MKTLTHSLRTAAAVLLAILLLTPMISAQQPAGSVPATPTITTLSAAVTTTNGLFVTVASTTGITATSATGQGTPIYADGEEMSVSAINGTVLTVVRGVNSTRASQHLANAVVYVAPATAYTRVDPQGTCTAAQNNLQLINVASGFIWNCVQVTTTPTFQWAGWINNPQNDTKANAMLNGTQISTAQNAYTVKLTDYFISVQSINTTVTITLPAVTGLYGKTYIIQDESAALGTNNILVTATGGFGSASGSTGSITMNTNFQTLRLKAGTTRWIAW